MRMRTVIAVLIRTGEVDLVGGAEVDQLGDGLHGADDHEGEPGPGMVSEHEHPQADQAQRAVAITAISKVEAAAGALSPRKTERTRPSGSRGLAHAQHGRSQEGRWRYPVGHRARQRIVCRLRPVRLRRLEGGQVKDRQAAVGAYDVASTVAGGEGAGVVLDDAQGDVRPA